MLPLLSLWMLALAVSLDGFGVGIMYGLRKIRIPLVSVAIISGCSGLIIYASMQAGTYMSNYVSPETARFVGAAILIGIGIWAVVQMLRQREDDGAAGPVDIRANTGEPGTIRTVLRIELKRLGLVIQILRTPALADMDRSGNISSSEAVLLGIALSLDAFGAGIGAALVGFKALPTAIVIALSSGTFIALGLRIGIRYAGMRLLRKLSFVPGCLLIVMGILKLF
jgi:putative sporulation protein YtaF